MGETTVELYGNSQLAPFRVGVQDRRIYYTTVKRVFDLCVASVLLVALAPLMLFIAICIRLDSPGPALFKQTRIGKGGKPFTFYKFRSMHVNNDPKEYEQFFKAFVNGQAKGENGVHKPIRPNQVTRVGRILRKTSLDELPQLINILKGEMSFVGPRPNVPWEVEAYQEWHKRRLEVLPGITGLAQIRGRSRLTFDQIVRYDIEYIENQSLWLDLKILWQTIPSVLGGNGAG